MIKFAVCEDDKQDRELLQMHIEKYANEKKLEYNLRMYDSAEKFCEAKFSPDILFLDILMNEKDGIQLGREIKKEKDNIVIIYTTNLKEKMTTAFNQIHSFGYLLKPIEKKSLFCMLDDAISELNKNMYIHTVTFESQHNTLITLNVMDIYYFEYTNRRIRIVTKKRNYICIKEKISDIAEKMEPYGFIMSHQSFVVNLYYIDRIAEPMLIMENGDEVYLAQKRASAVRNGLVQVINSTVSHGVSNK